MQWPTLLGLGPRAKVRVRVKVMGNVGVSHQGWSYSQYCVILCIVFFQVCLCALYTSQLQSPSDIHFTECVKLHYCCRIIRCFPFTVGCFIIASVSVDSSVGVIEFIWIHSISFIREALLLALVCLHLDNLILKCRLSCTSPWVPPSPVATGAPHMKILQMGLHTSNLHVAPLCSV